MKYWEKGDVDVDFHHYPVNRMLFCLVYREIYEDLFPEIAEAQTHTFFFCTPLIECHICGFNCRVEWLRNHSLEWLNHKQTALRSPKCLIMVINSIPPQTQNKWLANLIFLEHFSPGAFPFICLFWYILLRDTLVHLFQRSPPCFRRLAQRHFKTDSWCQVSDLSVSGQSPQAPNHPSSWHLTQWVREQRGSE